MHRTMSLKFGRGPCGLRYAQNSPGWMLADDDPSSWRGSEHGRLSIFGSLILCGVIRRVSTRHALMADGIRQTVLAAHGEDDDRWQLLA